MSGEPNNYVLTFWVESSTPIDYDAAALAVERETGCYVSDGELRLLDAGEVS